MPLGYEFFHFFQAIEPTNLSSLTKLSDIEFSISMPFHLLQFPRKVEKTKFDQYRDTGGRLPVDQY